MHTELRLNVWVLHIERCGSCFLEPHTRSIETRNTQQCVRRNLVLDSGKVNVNY